MSPRFASLEAMPNHIFRARALILLLLLSAAGCSHARPRRPAEPSVPQREAKSFAIRYVVKLTPAAGALFPSDSSRSALTSEQIPVEPLRAASSARKITLWKPVTPDALKEDPVGLNRMFVLIADEETDVKETVQAFEALTQQVEYIEPGKKP